MSCPWAPHRGASCLLAGLGEGVDPRVGRSPSPLGAQAAGTQTSLEGSDLPLPPAGFAPLQARGPVRAVPGPRPAARWRPLPGRPLLGAPLPRTPACQALGSLGGAMDDLRVQWIRDRVYRALGLTDPQLFEELLVRDDGEAEDLILHFLNQTSEEEGAATLFVYRKVVPEEVEVEVDTGEPAAPSPPPAPRPPSGAGLRWQGLWGSRVSRGSCPCSHSPLGKEPLRAQSGQTFIQASSAPGSVPRACISSFKL